MSVNLLTDKAREIEALLDEVLPPVSTRPAPIHEAMRYAVLGGGKRLRAIMAVAACESVGGDGRQAHGLAAAVEMIHAYSLVHDDLPSMDDDDLRRGKPTVHRKYGEAVAILTGDALLTAAFAELARMPEKYGIDFATTVAVIAELAEASGSQGMVGGQTADILAAQAGAMARDEVELLRYIHSHKTGALFTAVLRCGGMIGGASPRQLASLTTYGEHFGLAFQITDDILDEIGSEAALGKATRKDQAMGKLTYPRVFGLEQAKAMERESVRQCLQALDELPEDTHILRELALMVVERDR